MRRKKFGIILISFLFLLTSCGEKDSLEMSYHSDFVSSIYDEPIDATIDKLPLMASDLCVINPEEEGTLKEEASEVAKDLEEGAILFVDNDENTLLYGKNIYERLYPASLTKLMTAYVVYKYADLDKDTTISKEAITLNDSLAKKCGLKEGDVINIHVLLKALLVASGNDAAKAAAIAVSGTEEEFVALMNEEAKKLGATGTHFSNSHGLHADDHYTTIYDIYLIFHELLKIDDFVETIGLSSYKLEYKDKAGNPQSGTFSSTNRYHTGNATIPAFFEIQGGKTGTTNEAGSCIILYCHDIEGKSYIISVLNAPDATNLYSQLNQLLECIPVS